MKRGKAKQQQAKHDEYHKYVTDLADLHKLRRDALREGNSEEVKRYDTIIEVAQKTLIELSIGSE